MLSINKQFEFLNINLKLKFEIHAYILQIYIL